MSKDDKSDDRQWLHIPSRKADAARKDNANTAGVNRTAPDIKDAAPQDTTRRGETAEIARSQINRIYDTNPPHGQAKSSGVAAVPATYDRNDEQSAQNYDWHTYHTAWQDYYQQYYQRYYSHWFNVERQKLQQTGSTAKSPAKGKKGEQANKADKQTAKPPETFRSGLLGTVNERTEKTGSSTHFLPIISAVGVGLIFFLVQFNKLIAAEVNAYVSPSTTVSDNVIVNPNANVPINKDPRVIIPKINVDAPLVLGLESLDNSTTQKALEKGVVHYPIPGASSLPGQTGNSVFLGHSSHTVFNAGDFKFVFVLLPRMQEGDLFYINYEGQRYVYRITRKQVITPDQVDQLVVPADKPMATLVTCVPIGTNAKRLLVFGEQISPDPSKAERVDTRSNSSNDVTIPGNSPTLLERLFGA